MNFREQYESETNWPCLVFDEEDEAYTLAYVEWLEKRLENSLPKMPWMIKKEIERKK